MTYWACREPQHGDCAVMAHTDDTGRVVRYEITEIDDLPGDTILCAPEVIKKMVSEINFALAANRRVRAMAEFWANEPIHGLQHAGLAVLGALDGEVE